MRRSFPFLTVVGLIAAAAPHCADAQSPGPTSTVSAAGVSVTVRLPANRSGRVVSLGDTDLAFYNAALRGLSPSDPTYNYQLFLAAITKVKALGAATLYWAPGTYRFQKPSTLPPNTAAIDLSGLQDVTVQASGVLLQFTDMATGILIAGTAQRVLLRGVTVDWAGTLAYPGYLQRDSAGTPYFTVLPYAAYAFSKAAPPVLSVVEEFDLQNRTWPSHPPLFSIRHMANTPYYAGTAPTYSADTNGFYFSQNDTATLQNVLANNGNAPIPSIGTVRQPVNAVDITGQAADITLDSVTVYQAPGMAFINESTGSGFHMFNCADLRNPADPSRMLSSLADAANVSNGGNVIIENSEFAFQEDDGINLHAGIYPVSSILGRVLTLTAPFNAGFLPNDSVTLVDPNFRTVYSGTIVQVSGGCTSGTCPYRLSLDSLPPAAIGSVSLIDQSQAPSNYVIRNNSLHDNRGHGVLVQSSQGAVVGNATAHTTGNGISLYADLVYWMSGPGPQGVSVWQNTIDSANLGAGSTGLSFMSCFASNNPTGYEAALELTARVTNPPSGSGIAGAGTLRRIDIRNNVIRNSPGLAMLVSAVDGATVTNTQIVNANQHAFNIGTPAPCTGPVARGSILVTHAANVTVSNTSLSGSGTQGVAVDSASVSGVTVQ